MSNKSSQFYIDLSFCPLIINNQDYKDFLKEFNINYRTSKKGLFEISFNYQIFIKVNLLDFLLKFQRLEFNSNLIVLFRFESFCSEISIKPKFINQNIF